ncbi:hypothetical protein VaNZ11_003718 [Volvox africanus]|uniref:Protein kinase domain-containing protein n=1 Tax=Volvox africanus TaxID=51714 RepID=A0ABQ5RUZ5_9CHLO|nr:hypothetical protein VaNZ11_003718 [Volvox africanus]
MGPKLCVNFATLCFGRVHVKTEENVHSRDESSVHAKAQLQQDELDCVVSQEASVDEGTNLSVLTPSELTALQSKLKVPYTDLTFHALIGKGSFKQVYRGKWNNTNVAIVAMRRGGLVTEARLMQRLGAHPNLVQFYRWSTDHRGNEYIVVELVPFGSLDKVLAQFGRSLRNRSKLMMCEQICHAMCELASEGVLHRDLAARNILVQAMQPVHVKVSDFGLARVSPEHQEPVSSGCGGGDDGGGCDDGRPDDRCKSTHWQPQQQQQKRRQAVKGSASLVPVRWSAPEVLHNGGCWSEKSDVYSYGVTMWEIFSNGAEPYASRSDIEAATSIINGDLLQRPKDCPHPVYALMQDCWRQDPAQRPSFRQIAGVFRRWRETTMAAKAASGAGGINGAAGGGGPAATAAAVGGQSWAKLTEVRAGTGAGADSIFTDERNRVPSVSGVAASSQPAALPKLLSPQPAPTFIGVGPGAHTGAETKASDGGIDGGGSGYVDLASLWRRPEAPMLVDPDGAPAATAGSSRVLPAILSGEVLELNGQHQHHQCPSAPVATGVFVPKAELMPTSRQPQLSPQLLLPQPAAVLGTANSGGMPSAARLQGSAISTAPSHCTNGICYPVEAHGYGGGIRDISPSKHHHNHNHRNGSEMRELPSSTKSTLATQPSAATPAGGEADKLDVARCMVVDVTARTTGVAMDADAAAPVEPLLSYPAAAGALESRPSKALLSAAPGSIGEVQRTRSTEAEAPRPPAAGLEGGQEYSQSSLRRCGSPGRSGAAVATDALLCSQQPLYVHSTTLADGIGPAESCSSRGRSAGDATGLKSRLGAEGADAMAPQLQLHVQPDKQLQRPLLEEEHMSSGEWAGRRLEGRGPNLRRNPPGSNLSRPSPLRASQTSVADLSRDKSGEGPQRPAADPSLRPATPATATPSGSPAVDGSSSLEAGRVAAAAAVAAAWGVTAAESNPGRLLAAPRYQGEGQDRLLRMVTDIPVEAVGTPLPNDVGRRTSKGHPLAAAAAIAVFNSRHGRSSASAGAYDPARGVRHVLNKFGKASVSTGGGGAAAAAAAAAAVMGFGGGGGNGPCWCCSSGVALAQHGAALGPGAAYGFCEACILSMEVETVIEPLLSGSTVLTTNTNRGMSNIRDGDAASTYSSSSMQGHQTPSSAGGGAVAAAARSPSTFFLAGTTTTLAACRGQRWNPGLEWQASPDINERALESGLDSLQASISAVLRAKEGNVQHSNIYGLQCDSLLPEEMRLCT